MGQLAEVVVPVLNELAAGEGKLRQAGSFLG